MGKPGASAWLGAAVVAVAPGALAQDADVRWTAEQQAVIDAVSNGPVGIEHDFDAWAAGYHADWTHWRVGNAQVRGRAAHMELVRDYIGGGARVESFEMTPVDVRIRGDIALLRYTAIETLVEAGGERRIVNYASAGVLTREGGEWRMLATNIVFLPTSEG